MVAGLQGNESYRSVYFETATGLLSLEGKGVLVTGGATGIGAAVVTALAGAGAYVTIADIAAIEGQRLMLDLVSRNKHVQYLYTTLPSFPSQTAAFHHAAAFALTHTLSLIIANTIPPPSCTSILTWLATTTTTTTTTTLPPPPTNSLDMYGLGYGAEGGEATMMK